VNKLFDVSIHDGVRHGRKTFFRFCHLRSTTRCVQVS
jgi:hypothetical protein